MKKIITLIISLAALFNAQALTLTESADSTYTAGDFQGALEQYLSVADSLGTSPDLLYNIGNTYYRLDDLGHAVVYYERALRLDPTHEDGRLNLEFVNTRIADKPQDNRSIVTRLYDRCVNAATANTWAWTAFGLFVVLCVSVVGYLVIAEVKWRKICFFGGGIILILDIFVISLCINGTSRASSASEAVITVPAAQLTTAPRATNDPASQAFLLHEGTKVEIIDSIPGADRASTWYEVRVGGEGRAWVQGSEIEII